MRQRRKDSLVHTVCACAKVHLVNHVSATLNYGQFCSLVEGYIPCETHTGGFEVRNNIALTVTVCCFAQGDLHRDHISSHHLKQSCNNCIIFSLPATPSVYLDRFGITNCKMTPATTQSERDSICQVI